MKSCQEQGRAVVIVVVIARTVRLTKPTIERAPFVPLSQPDQVERAASTARAENVLSFAGAVRSKLRLPQ